MKLEWKAKNSDKTTSVINVDITEMIKPTEDRIIPSNFKEIPEVRVIENDVI